MQSSYLRIKMKSKISTRILHDDRQVGLDTDAEWRLSDR